MDASDSCMSDEARVETEFVDAADAEAPTERDPRVHDTAAGMPPRGVALSVLWWLEGAEADAADAANRADRG
jgi:hypothetical protein